MIVKISKRHERDARASGAPTNQRGYTTVGGATQTLVLDRSLWSEAVKYNTQSFIPDF